MSNPWEKYQTKPDTSEAPWDKYKESKTKPELEFGKVLGERLTHGVTAKPDLTTIPGARASFDLLMNALSIPAELTAAIAETDQHGNKLEPTFTERFQKGRTVGEVVPNFGDGSIDPLLRAVAAASASIPAGNISFLAALLGTQEGQDFAQTLVLDPINIPGGLLAKTGLKVLKSAKIGKKILKLFKAKKIINAKDIKIFKSEVKRLLPPEFNTRSIKDKDLVDLIKDSQVAKTKEGTFVAKGDQIPRQTQKQLPAGTINQEGEGILVGQQKLSAIEKKNQQLLKRKGRNKLTKKKPVILKEELTGKKTVTLSPPKHENPIVNKIIEQGKSKVPQSDKIKDLAKHSDAELQNALDELNKISKPNFSKMTTQQIDDFAENVAAPRDLLRQSLMPVRNTTASQPRKLIEETRKATGVTPKSAGKVQPIKVNPKGILRLSRSQRNTLKTVKEEILQGEAGYRIPLPDGTGFKGIKSTFPKYFQNKGITQKEATSVIDKALTGKPLTARQKLIVEDFNQEFRGTLAGNLRKQRASEKVNIDSFSLKKGDTFKKDGELFTVKDFNEDGKLLIKGESGESFADDTIQIDRGTLNKGNLLKSPTSEKEFIEQQAKQGRDATKVQTAKTKLENRTKLQEKITNDKSKGQEDIFVKSEESKQTDLTGKNYSKGISNALGKDLNDPNTLGAVFGGEYKNVRQFIKENKLKLSNEEIASINNFAKKGGIRGGVASADDISNFISKNFGDKIGLKNVRVPNAKGAKLNTFDESKPLYRTTKSDPVQSVMDALGKVKPLRTKQEAIYNKARMVRAAKIESVGKQVPGEKGFHRQLGSLKGELPKVQFESIRKHVKQTDIDEMFNLVEKNEKLRPFEKITAKTGLSKIFGQEGGTLPTRSELSFLREVFPEELIKAVMDKKTFGQNFYQMVSDVLNIPRSIMATADLSAPLRQGVFFVRRQKQFAPAFRDMFKHAFNQKSYDGLMKRISNMENYKLMRDSKLSFTDLGVDLSHREERFMSNIVEKIPVLGRVSKGSNRAYTGFLNQLRADVFDSMINSARKQGIDIDGKIGTDIANYVNAATGRGRLGKHGEAIAPLLNGALFSPRLVASRLELLGKPFNPKFYIKQNAFIRKEYLKDLTGFLGIGGLILSLASLSPDIDVNLDPNNADFGKIKVGNTRYDIWGGFQQYVVLMSRMASGKTTSSTTGREFTLNEGGYKPTTRVDIALRSLRFKESPVASFFHGLVTGKTAIGKDFNTSPEIVDRMIPMITQDFYDLMVEDGIIGATKAVPSVFGTGVQNYGKQIPVEGLTPSGKKNVKFRPQATLGEVLVNKATGRKLTTIPESEHEKLRQEKETKAASRYEIRKAKKRVLETGEPETKNGIYIYLDDGEVKTRKTGRRKRRTRRTR